MALSTPGQKELGNLQDYLNNQPDVLIGIVKHRTSFKGETGPLHITHFEPEGGYVSILLHPPGKKDEEILRIPFEPALKTPYAARPTLLAWRDEAFRHYGVPQRPKIDYYSPPAPFPYTVPLTAAIVALLYAVYGQGHYADLFRAKIAEVFGKYMVQASFIFMIVTHVAEAAYMVWATRKHSVPLVPTIKWVLTTSAIGIASISEFWESVQYERLRVIYRKTDVGEIPLRVATTEKEKKE